MLLDIVLLNITWHKMTTSWTKPVEWICGTHRPTAHSSPTGHNTFRKGKTAKKRKNNNKKKKIAGHIYVPVFWSRKWLYHMIAFPFSGLTTRLLLWQFWARLHFQPSPFSQACQKMNVVRKQVNANLDLQVLDRSRNFSCIKMFLTACVLCTVWDCSNSKLTDKQYKTHRKVTKRKSKFSLILG